MGTDVRSSNIIPYCHISFPYITKFVINANHQRSQPTPIALRHVSTCGKHPKTQNPHPKRACIHTQTMAFIRTIQITF